MRLLWVSFLKNHTRAKLIYNRRNGPGRHLGRFVTTTKNAIWLEHSDLAQQTCFGRITDHFYAPRNVYYAIQTGLGTIAAAGLSNDNVQTLIRGFKINDRLATPIIVRKITLPYRCS